MRLLLRNNAKLKEKKNENRHKKIRIKLKKCPYTLEVSFFSADNSFYCNVKMNVLYPTNLYVSFMTHWINGLKGMQNLAHTEINMNENRISENTQQQKNSIFIVANSGNKSFVNDRFCIGHQQWNNRRKS